MSVLDNDDAPLIQPAPLFSSEQWLIFRMTSPTQVFWTAMSGLLWLVLIKWVL